MPSYIYGLLHNRSRDPYGPVDIYPGPVAVRSPRTGPSKFEIATGLDNRAYLTVIYDTLQQFIILVPEVWYSTIHCMSKHLDCAEYFLLCPLNVANFVPY
ncbi:hypothetical protein A0H81_11477 [Grifola frondosa]|uniref:Uncharacterized protein n=1 Tax=Grifola frondosa TaxID=5627 RepID=A0A1C7LWY9_GRIFR|nr:hypothetical protein A0H81_11477 [Grifola frondosa]